MYPLIIPRRLSFGCFSRASLEACIGARSRSNLPARLSLVEFVTMGDPSLTNQPGCNKLLQLGGSERAVMQHLVKVRAESGSIVRLKFMPASGTSSWEGSSDKVEPFQAISLKAESVRVSPIGSPEILQRVRTDDGRASIDVGKSADWDRLFGGSHFRRRQDDDSRPRDWPDFRRVDFRQLCPLGRSGLRGICWSWSAPWRSCFADAGWKVCPSGPPLARSLQAHPAD